MAFRGEVHFHLRSDSVRQVVGQHHLTNAVTGCECSATTEDGLLLGGLSHRVLNGRTHFDARQGNHQRLPARIARRTGNPSRVHHIDFLGPHSTDGAVLLCDPCILKRCGFPRRVVGNLEFACRFHSCSGEHLLRHLASRRPAGWAVHAERPRRMNDFQIRARSWRCVSG